ncbi:MAG TPA: sensor histidine kinase [Candidatus Limiplasma sp.]|nr:sensor histidine kinase [Candidatus Limiplasma sp.]
MISIFDRVFNRLRVHNSLADRMRFSFTVIMVLMLIPAITSIVMMSNYANSYHQAIMQVDRVASLRPIVNTEIPDEMWRIVAGQKSFGEGQQYELLDSVNQTLEDLTKTATGGGSVELTVARRTMDTLKSYIDRMGEQIQSGALVSQNQALLEEVRSVSSLVGDMLQKYITVEISAATKTSQLLQERLAIVMWLMAILLVLTFGFTLLAQRSLTRAVRTPISQLESMAASIAEGDLKARVDNPNVKELQGLTESLNIMAVKLQRLMDENRREQENLKRSELRTLQAQITPHFLYNTLDAIVWLAEAGRTEEVIHVTEAMSDFFRISLSQGRDWIPLADEVKHLQGYLTIQKIRYRDILDYEIDIPHVLHQKEILKLLIQPLVENAIYHGIKHRRGKGMVRVIGRENDGWMELSVTDNGAGMTPERLQLVRESLASEASAPMDQPFFGLLNVNKRIQLYYNQQEGLQIDSGSTGTTVRLRVPFGRGSNVQGVSG